MVSVVIPCFNSEKTIIRALESVLKQSYKNYEIIIVDDGSTDKTEKVVKVFLNEYKQVHYIYKYQNNKGPSTARNLGVKIANREYIAFLDSDDEWHREKLEIQMQSILKNNLNFLGSTYTYDNFDYESKHEVELKKYNFSNLLIKTQFSTPGVIIKKDLFILLKGFDENMKYAEDNDLWLRASLLNDLNLIKYPKLIKLHKSAYGESGLSSNMYLMYKGENFILKKLYKSENLSFLKYNLIKLFLFIKFIRRYIIKVIK